MTSRSCPSSPRISISSEADARGQHGGGRGRREGGRRLPRPPPARRGAAPAAAPTPSSRRPLARRSSRWTSSSQPSQAEGHRPHAAPAPPARPCGGRQGQYAKQRERGGHHGGACSPPGASRLFHTRGSAHRPPTNMTSPARKTAQSSTPQAPRPLVIAEQKVTDLIADEAAAHRPSGAAGRGGQATGHRPAGGSCDASSRRGAAGRHCRPPRRLERAVALGLLQLAPRSGLPGLGVGRRLPRPRLVGRRLPAPAPRRPPPRCRGPRSSRSRRRGPMPPPARSVQPRSPPRRDRIAAGRRGPPRSRRASCWACSSSS